MYSYITYISYDKRMSTRVLMPLMWSLVIEKLLQRLSVGEPTCLGYTDDIVIYARGKFEGTIRDL